MELHKEFVLISGVSEEKLKCRNKILINGEQTKVTPRG